jgi:hypothetical protein
MRQRSGCESGEFVLVAVYNWFGGSGVKIRIFLPLIAAGDPANILPESLT